MPENMIRHTIRIRESVEPEIYAELKKQSNGVASIRRLLSLAKMGLLAERMYLAPNRAATFDPVGNPMMQLQSSAGFGNAPAISNESLDVKPLLMDKEFEDDFDALDQAFETAINPKP